jgi:hypothetical protein
LEEIECGEDQACASDGDEIKEGVVQETTTRLVIIGTTIDTREAEEECGDGEEEGEESDEEETREEEKEKEEVWDPGEVMET